MEMSEEQKKALEEQKAQCPFCKIVKGELPTKKVYEDDKIVAILDINPAVKGHTLVMPKEHYPIMPLIPQDVFQHLFVKIKELSKCIKEALLCEGVSVFIANGGAAGQQSSHFMVHLIPREGGDGLSCFDLPENVVDVSDVYDSLKNNLGIMMNNHLGRMGKPQKVTKEQLLTTINSNPQLKDMIINKTDEFKKLAETNEQVKSLFKDFDVDEIVKKLGVDLDAVSQAVPKVQDAEVVEEKDKLEVLREMLNSNPNIVDKTPEELLELIKKSEKYKNLASLNLKEIEEVLKEFKPSSIEDLAK